MSDYLIYLFIRGATGLLAWLPFAVLYPLSDFIYTLLYKVLGYRKKVIDENLQRIFPKKTPEERKRLRQQFYQQFADTLVESIKGLSMSEEELRQRYHYKNPELPDQLALQYGGLLLLGGHYANWEWGVQSFPLWVKTPVVGIFKPLKNKYLNAWLQKRRCRFGLQLTPMAQVGRALVRATQAQIYVLIADQMPSDSRNAIRAEIHGCSTPFLHGPEKLARRTGFPVVHFRVIRQQRGYYSVRFELLSDTPQSLTQGELTQRYAKAIGETIAEQPDSWLWSHRRWKW